MIVCLPFHLSHSPPMMKPGLAIVVVSFLFAHGFPLAGRAEVTELRTLQLDYEAKLLERVTDVHTQAFAKLDENYAAGVDRELASAKAAGDLVSALALEAEKKRIAFKEDLPDADGDAPKSLSKLRSIYRKESAKLNGQRAAAHSALLTPFITQLKQLEAELTKADRLADAKSVMDYRLSLGTTKTEGKPATPSAVATTAKDTGTSRPAAPGSPTAPAPAPVPDVLPAKATTIATELRAKGEAKDLAPGIIAFDGPTGDGRRGAKGILLTNDPAIGKAGTIWAFTYVRQGTAQVLEIIHPHGSGQVVIHVRKDGIGVSTPESWTECGYGAGDVRKIKEARDFNDVFPLKDGQEYPVISRLDGQGGYQLTIDGKIVATARISKTYPLSLEIKDGVRFPGAGRDGLEFKGPDLPLKWTAGYAALLVGPIDNGANICRDISFASAATK